MTCLRMGYKWTYMPSLDIKRNTGKLFFLLFLHLLSPQTLGNFVVGTVAAKQPVWKTAGAKILRDPHFSFDGAAVPNLLSLPLSGLLSFECQMWFSHRSKRLLADGLKKGGLRNQTVLGRQQRRKRSGNGFIKLFVFLGCSPTCA